MSYVCIEKVAFRARSTASSGSDTRVLCRTEKVILHSQMRANDRQVHIYRHIDGFGQSSSREPVVPVMSRREGFAYLKVAAEPASEIIDGANIAVWPVDRPVTVTKVGIGHNESAAVT